MAAPHFSWLPGIACLMAMPLVALDPSSGATLPSAIAGKVDAASAAIGAPVGYVAISRNGRVDRHLTDGLDPARSTPVASASKWVAVALIMTAVDRGELRLNDRVDRLLPELDAQVGSITLAQLISHRAGIDPDLSLRLANAPSLEASVQEIGRAPLVGAPGRTFAYGGSSMQIAARMLEKATGRSWQQLFDERLAKPLGLTSAHWSHPLKADAPAPQVAGGLSLSLGDYTTFLQMILQEGHFNGGQILSRNSIQLMETDTTAGITDFRKPAVVPAGWRYGLGLWCEVLEPSRRCSRVSSPGAFGVYPWIDRKAGVAGLFFTRSTLPKALPYGLKLQAVTLSGKSIAD